MCPATRKPEQAKHTLLKAHAGACGGHSRRFPGAEARTSWQALPPTSPSLSSLLSRRWVSREFGLIAQVRRWFFPTPSYLVVCADAICIYVHICECFKALEALQPWKGNMRDQPSRTAASNPSFLSLFLSPSAHSTPLPNSLLATSPRGEVR
jgi:hypothetical protein